MVLQLEKRERGYPIQMDFLPSGKSMEFQRRAIRIT
jgi:hypothetical protein